MTTLAELASAALQGGSPLPATLLPLLDDFFSLGTALQLDRSNVEAARALSADARAVFELFLRAGEDPQLGDANGLLHVTRLAPFCQIFGLKNAAAVGQLLDAMTTQVSAFPTTLGVLRQLYTKQLKELLEEVMKKRRGGVVALLHRCLELSLSLCGMTSAVSTTNMLLLDGKDVEAELAMQDESLLYGLVRCYELALPILQGQLLTFDEVVAGEEMLKIAETRHTLLLVLGHCVAAVMDSKTQKSGEELLAGLHALSNGSLDDDAEHGSFLSDLWYLSEFKDKVAQFFDECEMDLENFSYLDMVIEELPRRRILPTMLAQAEELEGKAKPEVELSAGAKEWKAPEVVETKPAAPQKEEVETEVLAPMVLQVKDFFPDLGEGFVELCLLSSNLQVEAVINFLLESNPPPVLIDVPQDLKRSDPEFERLEAQITGKPAPAPKVKESKKLDPSRVWVGKKAMEKTYDPKIANKDQQLAEKVKELVDMYEEEEDEYGLPTGGGANGGVAALDEYDDDYNDEFDDFVPFSIRDGGSADDQDAIREQNRRMRVKEEKDAFWEGMKNRNRDSQVKSALGTDEGGEEEGKEESKATEQKSTGRSAGGPPQGSSGPKQQSTRRNDKRQGGGEKKPDEPLTPQQIQRQRARKDKNKAKVANHNRKDRAMKKMG